MRTNKGKTVLYAANSHKLCDLNILLYVVLNQGNPLRRFHADWVGVAGTDDGDQREAAEGEIEASHRLGVSFVSVGEADRPQRLQMIDDPPPFVAPPRGHAAC